MKRNLVKVNMAVNIEDRGGKILYYGYGVDDMIHIWGSD